MNKEVKEESETESKMSGGDCVGCIFVGIYTFYLMVAKFLYFRFVLLCVFFCFVLYCFVSLIVLFRFVSRFVLFCSCFCFVPYIAKIAKLPEGSRGRHWICVCWRHVFSQNCWFSIGFIRFILPPPEVMTVLVFPTFLHFFAELCAASKANRQG